MKPYRFVFEKGVSVQFGEDGYWYLAASSFNGKLKTINPNKVGDIYGVRPILMSNKYYTGDTIDFLLPKHISGKLLDINISELEQIGLRAAADLHKVFNLVYITGAVVYHCKALANAYQKICSTFSELSSQSRSDADTVMFGHHSEPYYEFDALITAARRAYDTTRYILWKYYGPSTGSVPSSFKKCLPLCINLPDSIRNRLATSWDTYGERITEYRDCIQHYVPVNFGLSSARMDRINNEVWSMTLYIPDNPEAKSNKKLNYSQKIDALSYSWEITTEVVNIAKDIMESIETNEATQQDAQE